MSFNTEVKEIIEGTSLCVKSRTIVNFIYLFILCHRYDALELLRSYISNDEIQDDMGTREKITSRHDISEWRRPKGDVANLFRSHRDLSSAVDQSSKFVFELFEAVVRRDICGVLFLSFAVVAYYTHTHTYN